MYPTRIYNSEFLTTIGLSPIVVDDLIVRFVFNGLSAFRNTFKRVKKDVKNLLILNGHESYLTIEFI